MSHQPSILNVGENKATCVTSFHPYAALKLRRNSNVSIEKRLECYCEKGFELFMIVFTVVK